MNYNYINANRLTTIFGRDRSRTYNWSSQIQLATVYTSPIVVHVLSNYKKVKNFLIMNHILIINHE